MRFTYASEAAEAVFGLPPQALIGRNLAEFSPVPCEPAELAALASAQPADQWRTEDLDIRRPDGRLVRCRSAWMPVRSPDGVVRSYIGGARDITAEHAARSELAATQRRFDEVAVLAGRA